MNNSPWGFSFKDFGKSIQTGIKQSLRKGLTILRPEDRKNKSVLKAHPYYNEVKKHNIKQPAVNKVNAKPPAPKKLINNVVKPAGVTPIDKVPVVKAKPIKPKAPKKLINKVNKVNKKKVKYKTVTAPHRNAQNKTITYKVNPPVKRKKPKLINPTRGF
jgi:hypothetical protein